MSVHAFDRWDGRLRTALVELLETVDGSDDGIDHDEDQLRIYLYDRIEELADDVAVAASQCSANETRVRALREHRAARH